MNKLREALELISKPGAWTRGTNARDKFDNPVFANDASAVKWCSIGACLKLGADEGILARAAKDIWGPGASPQGVNDSEGFVDVVKMFELASELEGKVK